MGFEPTSPRKRDGCDNHYTTRTIEVVYSVYSVIEDWASRQFSFEVTG